MNIETELIHKWGIGDDPVFGSGSLKDIQTLCNECDKLRKANELLLAEVQQLRAQLPPPLSVKEERLEMLKAMDADNDPTATTHLHQ